MNYDIDIIYFFKVLNKWKKQILILVIMGIISGILKASFTPAEYSSVGVGLLPPNIGDLPYINLTKVAPDMSLEYVPSLAIISMITSRRMREGIDKHFDLKHNAGFKLTKIVSYSIKDFIIIVEVRGTDPGLTRDIANFCISNIDNINNDIKISSEKPALKMLDPASTGIPITNNFIKGMLTGGFFAVIFSFIAVFFIEYMILCINARQDKYL